MAAFERATVGLFVWWSANNTFASDPGSVLSISRLGVAETAERIAADARSRGLTVLAHTDHSGIARRDGLRIRPTRTMRIDHGSGGMPTRLIIWQQKSGVTVVSVDERVDDATQTRQTHLPSLLHGLVAAADSASAR